MLCGLSWKYDARQWWESFVKKENCASGRDDALSNKFPAINQHHFALFFFFFEFFVCSFLVFFLFVVVVGAIDPNAKVVWMYMRAFTNWRCIKGRRTQMSLINVRLSGFKMLKIFRENQSRNKLASMGYVVAVVSAGCFRECIIIDRMTSYEDG